LLKIFIDADACPVKNEVYKVARRYSMRVILVANSWMEIPVSERIRLEVVGDGFDEADDWIVDHVEAHDIVITADVPLADRCVKKDAVALNHTGKPFTEDTIGHALATRDLMTGLRAAGEVTSGPRPMQPKDRSKFLQQLDTMIQKIKRKHEK
jgi:uncharacterized protein YaiI (UPF0178 family)